MSEKSKMLVSFLIFGLLIMVFSMVRIAVSEDVIGTEGAALVKYALESL